MDYDWYDFLNLLIYLLFIFTPDVIQGIVFGLASLLPPGVSMCNNLHKHKLILFITDIAVGCVIALSLGTLLAYLGGQQQGKTLIYFYYFIIYYYLLSYTCGIELVFNCYQ
jgi:hypothetical protein